MYKNERIKNEIIKKECIKNERIKKNDPRTRIILPDSDPEPNLNIVHLIFHPLSLTIHPMPLSHKPSTFIPRLSSLPFHSSPFIPLI